MKTNKIIWGLVALLCLTTIAVSSGSVDSYLQKSGGLFANLHPNPTPPSEIKDNRDLTKYGIVAFDAPPIADQIELDKRRQKNQRYDKQDWVIKNWTGEPGGIGKITDEPPPPLFPVDESSLIVVGKIVDVTAHLSNDKTGIYSEFKIQIENSLKRDDSKELKTIIADREGGVVVYPGGQRVRYGNSNVGVPLLGSRYLLFLKLDEPTSNYQIITSYELDGEKVRQMETGRSFDDFNSLSKTAFIDIVRGKITGMSTK